MHEAGQEFEVPREGTVLTPEIPLSTLQKYVGRISHISGEPRAQGAGVGKALVEHGRA